MKYTIVFEHQEKGGITTRFQEPGAGKIQKNIGLLDVVRQPVNALSRRHKVWVLTWWYLVLVLAWRHATLTGGTNPSS
jgi:hypothetical protein